MEPSSVVEVLPSKSSKSAWNVSPPQPACSFQQLMNEELAKSRESISVNDELGNWQEEPVTRKLEILSEVEPCLEELDAALVEDVDSECQNDLMLALTLQAEFDREHDLMLTSQEKKFNRSSKVHISLANYRTTADVVDEYKHEFGAQEFDSFAEDEKYTPAFDKRGICKSGNTITTKHDAKICGRRNACRVMELPPGIETGDGFDMKLSNRVYNKLKEYSKTEEKRNKRLHDKVEKSTAICALDPKTRLMLFKMIDSDILESINGCISTGKESVVFHSLGGKSSEKKVPEECAIKVFKTTLNEFSRREMYIKGDCRFSDRIGKQNPRKIIHVWAEKELHNLTRLRKGGIPCPDAVILKKHILVMSFIGLDQIPAPKLKDVVLTVEQMNRAYKEIIEIIKKMFVNCQLVHADLSEFNILWHDDGPWIIDVSQAVDRNHPQALEFLLRDCLNVTTFFRKHDVSHVLSPDELFREITGMNIGDNSTDLLCHLKDYERNMELLTFGQSEKPYPFDSVFVKKPKTKNQL